MSEEEKEFYGDEEHFLLEYDDEIEELKADIEEYRDSTTWWSSRFNAVERDNRKLKKENKRLHSIIKEVKEKIEGIGVYSLKSGNTLIAVFLIYSYINEKRGK